MQKPKIKTPRLLQRIQKVLQAKMPPTWRYEPLLWHWVTHRLGMVDYEMEKALPIKPVMSKKLELCLLEQVGYLLQPLSLNEGCRNNRKPWRNLDYTPKSPIGDYHWAWTAVQVICAWRCEQPFVQGFVALCDDWGRDSSQGRDSNPYRDAVRHAEWDSGWILGIEVMSQSKKGTSRDLLKWIEAHEAEIAATTSRPC